MVRERFTFQDASEICLAPFLAEERRREAAWRETRRSEARRASGVSWSGMGPHPAPDDRGEAELQAAAGAAMIRAQVWRQSARGRFLQKLKALEALGFVEAAETARAAFARGFAAPGQAVAAAEVGVALNALGRIGRPQAREACLALSDLLAEELRSAAE